MADKLTKIELASINSAPDNLRTRLTDIQELADSIAFIGLLEPIRVIKNGESYQVIAGHRRLAALILNGETHTQAVVQTTALADSDRTAAMLIENMQRVDLDIAEQVEGVRRLLHEHEMTQADIATNLGVSKQWVTDRLAILNLDADTITPKGKDVKPLAVKHLAMLGSLDEKRRERLIEKAPVPNAYSIEEAWNKQNAKAHADKELAKALKEGYLVCTEPELKKIMKTDAASLSGVPQMIKTVIGAAGRIGNNYEKVEPGETVIVLSQIHGWATKEKHKAKVYILSNSGGYFTWSEMTHRKAREDTVVETDEVWERNEALRLVHEEQCMLAEIRYLSSAKPAALIQDVLLTLLDGFTEGWRAEHRILKALGYLELGCATEDQQEDWIAVNYAALRAYATKTASNLARTIAAFRMIDSRKEWPGVEYPEAPEYEGYEDDEDEDELVSGL